MQKRPWEISDLLAVADGEPRDAQAQVESPEAQAALGEIEALRAQLRELPDVPVDEELWLSRMPPARRSAWLRYPLATAATVFLASALGIFMMAGGLTPSDTGPSFAGAGHVEPGGVRLASLMNQSRDLETRLTAPAASQGMRYAAETDAATRPAAVTATERRLLYRLADVDAQIARLYEADAVDLNARVELWRQRVNLLESIVAARAGERPQAAQEIRSM